MPGFAAQAPSGFEFAAEPLILAPPSTLNFLFAPTYPPPQLASQTAPQLSSSVFRRSRIQSHGGAVDPRTVRDFLHSHGIYDAEAHYDLALFTLLRNLKMLDCFVRLRKYSLYVVCAASRRLGLMISSGIICGSFRWLSGPAWELRRFVHHFRLLQIHVKNLTRPSSREYGTISHGRRDTAKSIQLFWCPSSARRYLIPVLPWLFDKTTQH